MLLETLSDFFLFLSSDKATITSKNLSDFDIFISKKQKTNTIANYPVTLEDGYDIEITINKEEDKWEILLVDDKWKTIKRSYKEDTEILLTLTQIVIELTKINRQIEQHNKQLKQINN